MKANIWWNVCPFNHGLEVLYDCSANKIFTKRVREHEVTFVFPGCSDNLLVCILLLLLIFQSFHYNWGGDSTRHFPLLGVSRK